VPPTARPTRIGSVRARKAPEGSLSLDDGVFVSRIMLRGVPWNDAMDALLRSHDGDLTLVGTYNSEHGHGTPEYNNFCAYAIEVTSTGRRAHTRSTTC